MQNDKTHENLNIPDGYVLVKKDELLSLNNTPTESDQESEQDIDISAISPDEIGIRLHRGVLISRYSLPAICKIIQEYNSKYSDWTIIDNSIDVFSPSDIMEKDDGLYYNDSVFAKRLKNGVWIREASQDYSQIFFNDSGNDNKFYESYVSIVVCKDPVVYYQDIIHEITSGGQY